MYLQPEQKKGALTSWNFRYKNIHVSFHVAVNLLTERRSILTWILLWRIKPLADIKHVRVRSRAIFLQTSAAPKGNVKKIAQIIQNTWEQFIFLFRYLYLFDEDILANFSLLCRVTGRIGEKNSKGLDRKWSLKVQEKNYRTHRVHNKGLKILGINNRNTASRSIIRRHFNWLKRRRFHFAYRVGKLLAKPSLRTILGPLYLQVETAGIRRRLLEIEWPIRVFKIKFLVSA